MVADRAVTPAAACGWWLSQTARGRSPGAGTGAGSAGGSGGGGGGAGRGGGGGQDRLGLAAGPAAEQPAVRLAGAVRCGELADGDGAGRAPLVHHPRVVALAQVAGQAVSLVAADRPP